MDTTHFSYLPGSVQDSAQDGFQHKLTTKQQVTLATLNEWAVDNQVDLPLLAKHALHPSLTMLRYLRANKFDLDGAMRHIKDNLKWRRNMEANEVSACTDPQALLGCPINKLMAIFPHWHCGYDLELRPVLYKQYTLFDAAAIKAIIPIESIIKYHLWEQEVCMRLCKEQSLRTGYIVETTTTIMDLKNMRLGQVTKDFLAFMRAIADVDKAQYPETLGKMIIINAPSVFPFVWRMVKVWLDPDVAQKIQVLGDEREWGPVLTALVGQSKLPTNYGGQGKTLASHQHPYKEFIDLVRSEEAGGLELGGLQSASGSCKAGAGTSATVTAITTGGSAASVNSAPLRVASGLGIGAIVRTSSSGSASHSRRETETDIENGKGDDTDSLDSQSVTEDQFEDCVEEPSGLHNTAIGWNEEEQYLQSRTSTSTDPIKRSGSQDAEASSPSLSFLAGMREALRRVDPIYIFEVALRGFSSEGLSAVLGYALRLYFLISLSGIILSAYSLSSTHWISVIARVQMWTGVLMLLVSTSLLTVNFAGFLGWYTDNKMLLKMYALCLSCGFWIFFIITIACFVFATTTTLSGYTDQALESAIGDEQTRSNAKALMQGYNLSVGVGSLFFTLLTMVPMVLAFVLSRRWELHQGLLERCTQLKTVLKVTCFISSLAALVMMVYGGASLKYLFSLNLQPTVVPVFGLIYGGMSVLLVSVFGVWVSLTVHQVVVRFHYRFVLPALVVVLLAAASLSLGAIPESGVEVSQHFSSQLLPIGNGGEEDVVFKIQTQLLVVGVLCIFVCLFQVSSLLTTHKLSQVQAAIQRGEDLGGGVLGILSTLQSLGSLSAALTGRKTRAQSAAHAATSINSSSSSSTSGKKSSTANATLASTALSFADPLAARSAVDRACIAWAIIMGMFCVFFDGTYAVLIGGRVFNTANNSKSFVWQALSRADIRYVEGDSFLVTSSAISALIVGPLLLGYAWALFVRAPFRQVCGMVPTLLLLYTQALFYLIETNDEFKDLQQNNSLSLVLVILPGLFFLFFLPTLVFVKELRSACRSVSAADTYEMIVSMEMEAAAIHANANASANANLYNSQEDAPFRVPRRASTDATGESNANNKYSTLSDGSRRDSDDEADSGTQGYGGYGLSFDEEDSRMLPMHGRGAHTHAVPRGLSDGVLQFPQDLMDGSSTQAKRRGSVGSVMSAASASSLGSAGVGLGRLIGLPEGKRSASPLAAYSDNAQHSTAPATSAASADPLCTLRPRLASDDGMSGLPIGQQAFSTRGRKATADDMIFSGAAGGGGAGFVSINSQSPVRPSSALSVSTAGARSRDRSASPPSFSPLGTANAAASGGTSALALSALTTIIGNRSRTASKNPPFDSPTIGGSAGERGGGGGGGDGSGGRGDGGDSGASPTSGQLSIAAHPSSSTLADRFGASGLGGGLGSAAETGQGVDPALLMEKLISARSRTSSSSLAMMV